jgi:hypothetical protein
VPRLDYFQDQQKGPITRAEFLARALKAANAKACELGWIGCDRLHDWLLQIVGALTAPTSVALMCRVEEASTASEADFQRWS